MIGPGRRLHLIAAGLLSALTAGGVLAPSNAIAQQGVGALTGVVKDNSTGAPLEGVVVTVTSPNIQEAQVAATDKAGFYRLAQLPPGTYQIRFDRDGFFPSERGGIVLRSDTALRINGTMAPAVGAAEEVVITQRPTIDVGSSSSSTTIDREMVKRVPLSAPGGKGSAARSFESVAEAAPQANNDLYGAGVNGATSPENHYSIDGLSVGNPGKGTVGTALSTEFIHEVNVVSAGYMPEYGRATGGVLNVVTKSGSNQFRGSVFSFFSPGALEGDRTPVIRSAQPVAVSNELNYVGDVGFDLGGPIIKDKLWFYTGWDISNTNYKVKRGIYRTLGRGTMATPDGVIDPTPIFTESLTADSRTVQGMGKLTWSINADNRLTFAAYGTPTVSGGGAKFDGQNITPGKYSIDPLTGRPEGGGGGAYSAGAHQFVSTPLDASLKLNSQFLGKKLLLDVMVGTHLQTDSMRAADGSKAGDTTGLAAFYNVNWRRNAIDPMTGRPNYHSITEFENIPTAARCNEMVGGLQADCLVSDYVTGAPRDLNEAGYSRYHTSVIVSYLANFLGHHLIKAGFDGELTGFKNTKSNRVFVESSDGTQFDDEERFGFLTGPDSDPNNIVFIDPLRKKTQSLTIGGFIQDSWSVMDKVTVNLGLRYDTQYFYNTAGQVGLSLPNQWSPRMGLIYDPTQQGRAKLYINYARYYENAPLGFADVVLVGEPQVRGGHVCNPQIYAQQRTTCQEPGNLRANSNSTPRAPNRFFTAGGLAGALDPDIEASSSDEISGGGEYELMTDTRLGLALNRRWINKWVEDLGPVVGLNGFAGNPGFGLGSSFPKAERTYQAATLFLAKTFSDSWLAQASYTMASLKGNYQGLFAPEDGYLGPNGTADFDSPNVSNNRFGALKGDIRNTLKLMGAKDWQITRGHGLGTGLSFRARSGAPTSYLGADPFTYPTESYLAARGAGPRLPWLFTADLQLAYRVAAIAGIGLTVTADVFNLLNWQRVVSVDEEYTTDNVVAVKDFDVNALKNTPPGMQVPNLPNDSGSNVTRKEGFGQPTGYQEPRVFRFGIRGEF